MLLLSRLFLMFLFNLYKHLTNFGIRAELLANAVVRRISRLTLSGNLSKAPSLRFLFRSLLVTDAADVCYRKIPPFQDVLL